MLLGRLGESLGWWNDVGDWLNAIGLILGIWAIAVSVSERTVADLHSDLREVADKVGTTNAILARIEERLRSSAGSGSP